MSVWSVSVPGLSLNASVTAEPNRLVVRTHPLLRLLTLFAYSRTVTFDRRAKLVRVERRFPWVVTERKAIPFGRIARIHYGFASQGTSWAMGERTDQIERYAVALELDQGARVAVATFAGEGSVATGLGGVLTGDDLIDFEGTQGSASERLVRAIEAMTGATTAGKLLHVANAEGQRFSCAKCARPNPPNKKACMYCGGPLKTA